MRKIAISLLALVAAHQFLSPLASASSIVFSASNAASVNLNNGDPFDISLTSGSGSIVLKNNTGKKITDFHFTYTKLSSNPTLDGSTFFSNNTPGLAQSDFTVGGLGNGIATDAVFKINLSAFVGTTVKANATFAAVPEPSTILSSSLALGIVAFAARRRQTRSRVA